MMTKPVKILLVEDDPLFVEMYQMAFKSVGYAVEQAFNGEEGLEKLKAMDEKPDMVLLDMMMPKKNGLEVLMEMKADNDLCSIPVIFLTNLGHGNHIRRALELGAVTYLEKSKYTPRETVLKVREIAEASRHDEQVPDVIVAVKHHKHSDSS